MNESGEELVRLTQYSHGAGCGCKISPSVLDRILGDEKGSNGFESLLVGHEDRDDAAVMDLGDGTAIISTTDFFMPIVDDPYLFGQIAATNAISDVYAMGGKPLMAIGILGWPVDKLAAEIAGQVTRGARDTCLSIGIPLAGGHSIDSPEPIFGLAVTGRIRIEHIKKNGGARPGDLLFLTKPLGIGVLSTAQKKGKLHESHSMLAAKWMTKLNDVGEQLAKVEGVHAMTDVTGFGLAGHLREMCMASNCSAEIFIDTVPVIDDAVFGYIREGCIPGGTLRNFNSFHQDMDEKAKQYKEILCDPQTSGGLLIAADPSMHSMISNLLHAASLNGSPVGVMVEKEKCMIRVS